MGQEIDRWYPDNDATSQTEMRFHVFLLMAALAVAVAQPVRTSSYGGEQPNIYEEIVISSGSLAIDFDPAQVSRKPSPVVIAISQRSSSRRARWPSTLTRRRSAGSRRPSSSPSRSESRRLRSEIFPPLPTNKYTHYSS